MKFYVKAATAKDIMEKAKKTLSNVNIFNDDPTTKDIQRYDMMDATEHVVQIQQDVITAMGQMNSHGVVGLSWWSIPERMIGLAVEVTEPMPAQSDYDVNPVTIQPNSKATIEECSAYGVQLAHNNGTFSMLSWTAVRDGAIIPLSDKR